MWKYVSRRVKDSIEIGINVRKSFTIQQNLNNSSSSNVTTSERKSNLDHHLDYKVVLRSQDPSKDKDKSDEKFKKKYHRLNNNNRCFLNALTWVK